MLSNFEKNWKTSLVFESADTAAVMALQSGDTYLGKFMDTGLKPILQARIAEAIGRYQLILPQGRSISPEAVLAMSEDFADHPLVRNLTISELKTFLTMAFKRQAFGKLYGGFGFDTLLEWFNTYMEDRALAVADYRYNQHLTLTSQEKGRRDRQEGDAWGNNVKKIEDIWQTKTDPSHDE